MSTAIFPPKFDSGDFEAWIRQFDACSSANGWVVTEEKDEKLLKLPAFLTGRAASHFYAITSEKRASYPTAVRELRAALCPAASRENIYQEFETRVLRPGEDPSVYRWELDNLLAKAESTLSNDAKKALVTRQFMRGLPTSLKLKLLEHDPTPDLVKMVDFAQRFQAMEGYFTPQSNAAAASLPETPKAIPDSQLTQLMSMVASIAEKQNALDKRMDQAESPSSTQQQRPESRSGVCFQCGLPGHFQRQCRNRGAPRQQMPPGPRRSPREQEQRQCFRCSGYGHVARECANNHLNY